jgi:hypothetical protein
MSMKWSEEEVDAVLRMRDVLKEELATVANNAEVVGDRCFIRFYRGHNRDVDTACTFMRNYLNWRVDKNVDSIRENIVKWNEQSLKISIFGCYSQNYATNRMQCANE